MPPTIRIFFALEMPESAKAQLSRFLGELKKNAKTHSIRWSKLDNLHITLQFMPEVRVDHVPDIIKSVQAELAGLKSQLSFNLGNIHLFPSPYRPRVIVLDVSPQEPLAALSKSIGCGITAMQYDIENRPFRAHLTLGRIKHQDTNLQFLSGIKVPPLGELSVENVVLYRSEPQEDGSHYTVLEKLPLPTTLKPSPLVGEGGA